jgi:hypothetical protein
VGFYAASRLFLELSSLKLGPLSSLLYSHVNLHVVKLALLIAVGLGGPLLNSFFSLNFYLTAGTNGYKSLLQIYTDF